MRTKTIDNTMDVIDSRDIIARIEFLTDTECEDMGADELSELAILRAIAKESEGCADWEHGEALIRESYFTDSIKGLIQDCYPMPKEFGSRDWPWRHIKIDYAGAADEAMSDYIEVDFDGVAYLICSN